MDLMIVVALTYVLAPGLSTYEYQDIQMLSSREERKKKEKQKKNQCKQKQIPNQVFVSLLLRCSQANNRRR
ncbi:hypothetical protein BDV39DRAFT_184881 [Aspergillus sergii]|uniref:Secreted protein n=1 Tax=Aspergillus sergii TaxID=1034303 RepID=A0A5N6WNT4_9EURO|nr:hypothetical protein BDV39DRAFT_184881 [Aspergillus sergii]